MLEIDCSRGEGGGQMVRTSVAMSIVTGKSVHLTRIRENRPTQGLNPQHCSAIQAVTDLTDSTVTGNTPKSRELTIIPGTERKTEIKKNIGTAGSISLVLQAMQLATKGFKEAVSIDITGGTNVMWAPPIDYYQQTLYPLMKKIGINAELEIKSRGYYPEGNGRVIAKFDPIEKIKPLKLTSLGELKSINGVCNVQGLSKWITEKFVNGCENTLKKRGFEPNIELVRTEGESKGACMSLVAEYENGFLSSSELTSKSKPAEQAGMNVANDLLKTMDSGETIDVYTADQILPYLAMAEGDSTFTVSRISRHLLSQMDTLEMFLDTKFGVVRKDSLYRFTVNPGGKE